MLLGDMCSLWRSQVRENGSIFSLLNANIEQMTSLNPSCLPDFSSSSNIIVASDYSGEHADSGYMVFSFIIADLEKLQSWDEQRIKVRQEVLFDNRRMAFKNLRDKQRMNALEPFLSAANNLSGFSFTLAIDTKIDSLFNTNLPLDLSNPDFVNFQSWTRGTLEKAGVIVHFLSFLLAGLLHPNQNLIWITDEDSIAANDDRLSTPSRK